MELVGSGKRWGHLEEAEKREILWQTFNSIPPRSLFFLLGHVVILPHRFLGLPELGVANISEVPEWLLTRSSLPKVAKMIEDIRVPLRFFKKGICDRRTDGENSFLEEDEENREARVVEDTRIPFRFFRNLHTPLDILEACSEVKDETQNGKRETSMKESDVLLKDANEKSVLCQIGIMENDVCTRELMKQIKDCGRVGRGVLRTM